MLGLELDLTGGFMFVDLKIRNEWRLAAALSVDPIQETQHVPCNHKVLYSFYKTRLASSDRPGERKMGCLKACQINPPFFQSKPPC
jgi:hypothetical protein